MEQILIHWEYDKMVLFIMIWEEDIVEFNFTKIIHKTKSILNLA